MPPRQAPAVHPPRHPLGLVPRRHVRCRNLAGLLRLLPRPPVGGLRMQRLQAPALAYLQRWMSLLQSACLPQKTHAWYVPWSHV